jgi:hypothetical protein
LRINFLKNGLNPKRTAIIDHVIRLCYFLADSITVKYIDQQQWSQLVRIVMVELEEVDEFFTVKSDGLTFGATPIYTTSAPIYTHIRTFLFYYMLQDMLR